MVPKGVLPVNPLELFLQDEDENEDDQINKCKSENEIKQK